jgi:hypothetical protein
VLSRVPAINEQDFGMSKYRIGETVKRTKGGIGVIRAIFTTAEGERCYAVESEGALDFIDETKLSAISRANLAAA